MNNWPSIPPPISDEHLKILYRAQGFTASLPATMEATMTAYNVVKARLGTPKEHDGDVDKARELSHKFRNEKFLLLVCQGLLEQPDAKAVLGHAIVTNSAESQTPVQSDIA